MKKKKTPTTATTDPFIKPRSVLVRRNLLHPLGIARQFPWHVLVLVFGKFGPRILNPNGITSYQPSGCDGPPSSVATLGYRLPTFLCGAPRQIPSSLRAPQIFPTLD